MHARACRSTRGMSVDHRCVHLDEHSLVIDRSPSTSRAVCLWYIEMSTWVIDDVDVCTSPVTRHISDDMHCVQRDHASE